MTALRYGDYQGAVEYEDGYLLVKILHIDDIITTSVDSAAAAQEVETCRAVGKEPCRPFKGSFNVRVSPELHRQVAMAAADANDTMNSWIAKALQERVDGQRTKRALLDPSLMARMIGEDSFNLAYEWTERVEVGRSAAVRPGASLTDLLAIPAALARQMSN